jgi:tRNA (adenine57-N1/adenine58-N1)-methyltransferase
MGFQILNSTMASGSTVLECGGGSGGFTTILARFIGDAGRVHVFERRAEFIELAQKNLARVGLEHRVTWHHRDPSLDGFAVEGVAGFDAAFIDVPEPWTLIKPAWEALKPGCSLTSLSPNVEQVRRTVEAMHQVGFGRIWTVETLERELLVRDTGTRPREMMRSHTGYLSFGARLQPGVPAEVEAAGEAGESDNIDENANTEG